MYKKLRKSLWWFNKTLLYIIKDVRSLTNESRSRGGTNTLLRCFTLHHCPRLFDCHPLSYPRPPFGSLPWSFSGLVPPVTASVRRLLVVASPHESHVSGRFQLRPYPPPKSLSTGTYRPRSGKSSNIHLETKSLLFCFVLSTWGFEHPSPHSVSNNFALESELLFLQRHWSWLRVLPRTQTSIFTFRSEHGTPGVSST